MSETRGAAAAPRLASVSTLMPPLDSRPLTAEPVHVPDPFQVVTRPGGRRIAVEVAGNPDGFPVILMHGTPGSRTGPRPRASVLYRMGVQLISYDRPGYGHSDPHVGRTVSSAADDAAAIADELGHQLFGVVGRSGGGPHALACAALLPERVVAVACLVSLAPPDAPGLDWYDGMNQQNVHEYSTAGADHVAMVSQLRTSAEQTNADPASFLAELQAGLSGLDRRVVNDIAFQRLLTRTYTEATQRGADGWIDDVLALGRDWGFDPHSVTCPTLLWHGEDDTFSPVQHTRWLARRIPHAELQIVEGAGHFNAMEALPEVLSWIVKRPLAAPSTQREQDEPRLSRARADQSPDRAKYPHAAT